MNIFMVMSAVATLFRNKFPYNGSIKNRLLSAAGFGVFVFLFLWVLRPFDMNALGSERLILLQSILYGAVVFVCIVLITFLFPLLFPAFFNEDKWTTGRQVLYMLLIMVVVGLGNCFTPMLLFNTSISWNNIFWYQVYGLITASLPIAVYTLYKQNRLLSHFEQKAGLLEAKLQEKLAEEKVKEETTGSTVSTAAMISIDGDYQQETITLPSGKLYYVASASNYVKVYFEEEGKVKYVIIRTTMKKVGDILAPWPQFFRCHRAWFVNLDKVQHVAGNAQGYKLQLKDVEEQIPVSRTLNTEFSDRLLAVKQKLK